MTEAPKRLYLMPDVAVGLADRWSPNQQAYVRADIADVRLVALVNLLDVLDAAGLNNLARGVQLGRTSWLVKARDRVSDAKAAVSDAVVA